MRKYLLLDKDLGRITNKKGLKGLVDINKCIPLLSISDDLKFSIFKNGTISSLFELQGFNRPKISRLLDEMFSSSSIQFYSCHKNSEDNHFISLSSEMGYKYRPSVFSNLFCLTNKALKNEIDKYEESVCEVFNKIQTIMKDSLESGYAAFTESFEPLISYFSPFNFIRDELKYKARSQCAYNMSFLILEKSKLYGVMVEIASINSVANDVFFKPPEDMDYIAYTNLKYPSQGELDTQRKFLNNNLYFQGKFSSKKADSSSFLTLNLNDTNTGGSLCPTIFMNTFFLFTSHSLSKLRESVSLYIKTLDNNGVSFNCPSYKTLSNYYYMFPGNNTQRLSGHAVSGKVLPTIISRIHGPLTTVKGGGVLC